MSDEDGGVLAKAGIKTLGASHADRSTSAAGSSRLAISREGKVPNPYTSFPSFRSFHGLRIGSIFSRSFNLPPEIRSRFRRETATAA